MDLYLRRDHEGCTQMARINFNTGAVTIVAPGKIIRTESNTPEKEASDLLLEGGFMIDSSDYNQWFNDQIQNLVK